MFGWMAFTGGISFADLGLKHIFSHKLESGDERSFADGNVILTKYENKGGMMGFLKNSQKELKFLSSISLVLVIVKFMDAVVSGACFFEKLGMALVSAGAISNVGERYMRDSVTDYLRLPKAKPIKDVVFNIGDIAVLAGYFFTTISFLMHFFRKSSKGRTV